MMRTMSHIRSLAGAAARPLVNSNPSRVPHASARAYAAQHSSSDASSTSMLHRAKLALRPSSEQNLQALYKKHDELRTKANSKLSTEEQRHQYENQMHSLEDEIKRAEKERSYQDQTRKTWWNRIRALTGVSGLLAALLYLDCSRPVLVSRIQTQLDMPSEHAIDKLEYIAGLSALSRANQDDIKAAMEAPRCLLLLEGPSNSGKSYLVGQLVKGRKNVAFFSWREDASASIIDLLKASFGVYSYGPGERLTGIIQDQPALLFLIKSALQSIQDKRRVQQCNEGEATAPPIPLLIIDDVQDRLKPDVTPEKREAARNFLKWTLEMSKQGLLNVIMLSSEPIKAVLEDLCGYDQRVDVLNVPFVDTKQLQTALQQELKVSDEEASYVVAKLGGNMGDLSKTLKAVQIDPKKTLTLKGAVDARVQRQAEKIEGRLVHPNEEKLKASGLTEEKWFQYTYYILSALSDRKAPISPEDGLPQISLAQLCQSWIENSGKNKLDSHLIARDFLKAAVLAQHLNLLRFTDGTGTNNISFHRPSQLSAFDAVRKSSMIQLLASKKAE